MEWDSNWGYRGRRSSATAKAGLATGIVGTSLGALAMLGSGANAIGRMTDNWGWNGYGYGAVPQTVVINQNDDNNGHGHSCSEDHVVNRYELGLQQQIAEKDSQIALRDANTYNDQKMLEMYKYVDGRLRDIEAELGRQAVVNQKTADSFQLAKQDLDCQVGRLGDAICNESRERACRDNTIITYANATFYPKSVANVTVGDTTTPQATYNPLPDDDCCCNGGFRRWA